MVPLIGDQTGEVAAWNVTTEEPPLTITLEGTWISPMFEESAITAPPPGAGLLRVIVAVDEVPPITVEGLSVSAVIPAPAVTVKGAPTVTPL